MDLDEEYQLKSLRRELMEDNGRAEGIAKAAWQLEDAMNGRLVMDYPSDMKAREAYFDWARANRLYGISIAMLYFISMLETPPWCDNTSNFWTWMDSDQRCKIPTVASEDLLLSQVPYLPPAYSLIVEGVLMCKIAEKLLLERSLQANHFEPLHVKYFGANNDNLIYAGLVMVAVEVVDMVCFVLLRPKFRIAFIPRTAFMAFLPQVLTLFSSIATVIQEFVTIAVFFVSGILLFAWVATMLFDDRVGSVTKGFDSFSESVNTMFVAGATDDFFECFRNSYTDNRMYGILWLVFLVIVHVLLLSLVLDTLVSAYTKLTETNEEEGNLEKVNGIQQAFDTLIKCQNGEESEESQKEAEITQETFFEFAKQYSKSPRTLTIYQYQAEIIFKKVDENGDEAIKRDEFFEICGVMQYQYVKIKKDSPVKEVLPSLWENPWFAMLRKWIDDGTFDDRFMNGVLLVNLALVVIETSYDLNHIPEASYCKKLELIFSFIYLTECGLKLCVWSWQEYTELWANTFDFVTTWLLLGSSVLEEVAGGTGGVKRYMNVLRLLRLVRVIKQLKKIPQVIFMVSTIIRLVTEAKDILTLLLVVMYFFTMLSVQLFGGLLYKSNPALQESEYKEAGFWVLNFNDFLMAFGVWVVMLLCEYKAEFTDAIGRTSKIPLSWTLFFIFYVFAVSIIFELVKAFTIEVFVDLHQENHEAAKEKKQEQKRQQKRLVEEEIIGPGDPLPDTDEAIEAAETAIDERLRNLKEEKDSLKAEGKDDMEDKLKKADERESQLKAMKEGLKDAEEGMEGLVEYAKDQMTKNGVAVHVRMVGDPRAHEKMMKALEEQNEEEEEEGTEEGEEGHGKEGREH